jgi:hypothetical protein
VLVDLMDFSEADRADYKQATAKWLKEVGAGGTATEWHNAGIQRASPASGEAPLE